MTRTAFGMLVAASLAISCEKPRTEIVLSIDTNLMVPSELDQVHVIVASDKAAAGLDQTYSLGSSRVDLPIVIGLVPDTDKSLGFRAVAEGLLGGAAVVQNSASTSFVPDQTLVLRLDLLRVCLRATCQPGETCGLDGRCASEVVPPGSLPVYGATRDASLVGRGDAELPGVDVTNADGIDVPGTVRDGAGEASQTRADSAKAETSDAANATLDAAAAADARGIDGGPDLPAVDSPGQGGDAPIDSPVSRDAPGVDVSVPGRPLGAACSAADQCASGFCVGSPGRCCDSPCNSGCQACSTGYCEPANEGHVCRDGACDSAGCVGTDWICRAGTCSARSLNCCGLHCYSDESFLIGYTNAEIVGPNSKTCQILGRGLDGYYTTACVGSGTTGWSARCPTGAVCSPGAGKDCAAAAECVAIMCR